MRTASNLIAEAQARLDTQKTAAAPPQPSVFGFNKSTNQFFSAGKTWSADNLSEVDSYDKAGYFDVDNRGKMPDGFTPVTPDAIRGWKEKKAAERGFGSAAAETGRQVMQGVADIPNMAVQAAAMSAPAGSWLEGQLGDAAKEYERTSRTPDTYGRGETAQAFIGAGRSIPSSVAAGVASVAAPIVGTGAAGYVMGASQAWDTYQRGLAAGLSPEDAKAAAIKTGSIEGIGETAADAIGARVTMGAGKVVGSLLRGASIGHGKRVAVDLLANAGLQSGTEYGQSYGQAAVERDAGISSQDPHAAGYEGFKQGLAMSALMAPFGIAAGVANRPGPTPPAPAPAAAQPPMPPATPGAPQLGYETPLQLGFNGVHGLNDESPIPQGYNPLSTPITSAGQAWQGMSPSMTGDSEIIGLQGAPGAPVSAGQAGAAWQQMPQSQQTLEGGYQNLDEQRAGAMQMQSERDAEAARKEDLVEQRGAAIRGVGTMPVSPSEGSATAVAPSVSPQEPQTPAELFTPETLQSKTRSEIAIIAQNLGINPNDVSAARKGRATKTELIAAVMKAQAPAEPDRQTRSADNKWAQAQETLSTPKRGPKSKKPTAAPVPPAVSDDTAAILGELEAAVATQPARVRGKITMPKQVLSGIMRAIKAPFTAYGTPATPRAYGDGTATPDPETEGKYMAQMIAVRDAAHKVIELAKSHYDNVANRTPTASKALLKKRPGETRETAGNTQANEVGAQTAKDVRETQVRLSSALKEFADAAGGMPNANALIAVIKGRIQQISSKNVDKAKKETTVDTMLSRAWKEYVDGVLDTPENIATVRSGEIRNSQEQQKRGAESEPLEKAATEGYNSRPKGKESAEAYATRQKQNAGAIGVLNYITRHGTQFEAFLSSAIATALKAGKTTPKLKFIEGGSPHYDPKTDTIYVSKTASPEVVLHETLHAALQWYVHTHPSHAAVLKLKNALKTVLSYDRASLSPKAQEVFDVLAKLEKKNPLDAVLELISYGATLREFNVALTQIKSSDKTGFLGAVSDLWKRITSLVQNFLGVRDTVANDVLDSTIKLLEEAADAGGERAPRKGAKLNDEGTLYAAVQSSTPASNATPPGGTPNVDLTKFTKKMLPNIITEHVFKAMGWDAVPEKFADAAGTVADYIRDKSPALSKYIGYINPNFNVPVPAREWFQQYKNEKHVSGIVTDALANKIASLPKDQVLDLMEYLDGDKTALKDNAEARELADMLLDHRAEYIKGLRSKEAQAFFRDLKFTETMIFAKGTDDVASNALGSRKLNELAAQKSDTQLTDNIYTPLDAMGNPVFDGRFYQVVQPNTLSPSGDPMVAGFVHESMVGKLPAGTAVATDGLVWTHAGKSAKEKDAQRFTAYRDAKAAIEEGKANTAANALRNTMAILAANYASNNLTDSLASLSGDTTYMAVFNNVKDIEAATGMRPAQGSILKLSAAEAKSGRLQGIYRSKHQWVQVPNGVTYGELAGMLVRSDVWSAIQDMTDRRPLHNVSALHTTMRTFKKAKTVYNPATHVTNIASNVTLAMMHDIPMPTVAQATRLLFQYATNPNKMDAEERRVVHAFMNSGAMLGDFSMLEVKKDLYEAYKTATAENEPSGVYAKLTAWAGIEKAKAAKFAEYAKVGKDKLGTADDKITALYAAEDNAFRLAAFLSKSGEIATRKGKTYLTPQEFKEAGDYARFAFLDYDIDSKAVKIMRQSVLPFVSWSYAIMPVLGHIALHKPWKLVNVLLAYSLLDAAMGGDDDDEKRKEGPEKFRSRLWGVGPHAYIRVPFMGDEKNPVYFKLGAYMPTGNWMDKQPMGFLGINNWPQPISPGGPFTNVIIGLMGGIDPYTGKPLSAPTDSTWEEVADRAKFMGATFTPGWTPAAVDVATKAVGGRGKPEKGLAGNPVSNLEAARRFGGLQLETFNTDEATIQRNIAIRSEKAAFEKELAKLRRAEARYEKPDWEAFNKRRDELLARRDERIKDIKGEE
jgi:hypothetical protein